jgi:DNA-directed RNA polymerase specialized sigma24 family protein
MPYVEFGSLHYLVEYIDADDLAARIRTARKTGVVSDELALKVSRIASGVWRMYQWLDHDDFLQESVLRMIRYLPGCDTSKTPRAIFNWITSIPFSVVREIANREDTRKRRIGMYAESLGDRLPQT